MTESAPRTMSIWSNVRATFKLVWAASRVGVITTAGLAAVAAVFPVALLWLTKTLVDAIVEDRGRPFDVHLVLVVVGLGVVATVTLVIQAVSAYQRERLALRVVLEAQQRFLASAGTAPLPVFDDADWHDRMARATGDLDWRPIQLTETAIQILSSLVSAAGMVSILVFVEPLLVALATAAIIPVAVVRRRTSRRLYGHWRQVTPVSRRQDYLRGLLTDIDMAQEVRAYDLAPHLIAEHRRLGEGLCRSHGRLFASAARQAAVAGAMAGGGLVVAFALVAHRGLSGQLSPGDLAVLAAAIVSLTNEVSALSDATLDLAEHAEFLGDFVEVTRPGAGLGHVDNVGRTSAPRRRLSANARGAPALELDEVTFRYPGTNRAVLRRFSLRVEPGEVVALVGENGAGKSTLIKLVLGLYMPDEGSVIFDGVDLRSADLAEVRSRIGVVLQNYPRYNLSVRENVAFGNLRDAADDERIARALEAAGARQILQLPSGLDAMLGRLFEHGRDLSGGEWQRMALARLVYRDADMWVLDEPTAALDARAEAAIFGEWRQRFDGRTGLLVSHRFSTVRTADRIAVVADGALAELGTHDELVAAGGRYAEMFKLQAKAYR